VFDPNPFSLVIKIGTRNGTTGIVTWIGNSDICVECGEALTEFVKKLGGVECQQETEEKCS